MLVIELAFPAGRYHATGWGRHVNEGVPEWPPSPYRLFRALFDVWKRKRPGWDEARIERVLGPLAGSPPLFRLPPASESHTRSFLSKNELVETDRTLIFDAFVSLGRRESVLAGWPDATLQDEESADLDELLSLMNYLGRSESWVSAKVLAGVSGVDWNCVPWDGLDRSDADVVQVAVPRAPDELRGQKWLDSLAFSTGDLLRSKRSEPPAMKYINYFRPARCFSVEPRPERDWDTKRIEGVLYAFDSRVLPMVTATLEIAEQARKLLMGEHKSRAGGPERVSQKFSGKDAEGRPLSGGHKHAYILPFDDDGDGRLDHMLVVCREPFDQTEVLALDGLRPLWQPDGRPHVRCIPVKWGQAKDLWAAGSRFVSVTPFVPCRHHRQGRGPFEEWLKGEVARECRNHGFPAPARIEFIPRTRAKGHAFRWLEFRRNRKDDSSKPGYGFELQFASKVDWPIAIGYGCHFGLGQFRPE